MAITLSLLAQFEKQRRRAALCTIVSTQGDTPRRAGSKMVVFDLDPPIGTVGGGNVEFETIEAARKIIESRRPTLLTFHLKTDLGMVCGGEVTVYIEPLVTPYPLYIFGAGHVGKAIAKDAARFGFEPILIDMRGEMFVSVDTSCIKCWHKEYMQALQEVTFSTDSFFVITTPRHQYDEQILAVIAAQSSAYIGMMASKAKVALARESLLSKGILTLEQLDRIDMPIGIPFACETPEEIAISVVARLIDVKNKKEGYDK